MPTYTVQCGYAGYYANIVVVEAPDLETALTSAIEKANGDPAWRSLDHCGDTFIDAVAEGEDVDPWHELASAVPVPAKFSEDGERNIADEDLHTILAALRWYQESKMDEPDNRPEWLHDIATNGDTCISLDGAGIDSLCERLNCS